MNDLNKSWLWRHAFVEENSIFSTIERNFFRNQLDAMRERVKPLVSRIQKDMPGYTIHDETHLDALWEIAALITPPELSLNPPEAFVLGGAILLHDAGMTIAAYPRGMLDLKQTLAWSDAMALRGLVSSNSSGTDARTEVLQEAELQVASDVLRRLHAEKAAELATQGWQIRDDDTEKTYLIEAIDVRRYYGALIGRIASSHWWSIGKVEENLSINLGPLPPRTSNSVDALKLACILRVSDALHLDARRAPRMSRALEQPTSTSSLHWTAQKKLGFPQREGDALIFTAGEAFARKDADAWWVAYDAIATADRELRDADRLLRDKKGVGLLARRAKGVGDPQTMANYLPVEGWRPIETAVRVSNILGVVETLGGDKLYGDDPTAPLRELLQNAMDAVQARRRLQNRDSKWGNITVALKEIDGNVWLSVEDTGVGMSERILAGTMLDFGSSLWRSSQILEEFPGLAGRGMNAAGRFGIGFFSVFMLGDHVRVITRRYDMAESAALELEFKKGLAGRPILSQAMPGDAPVDGGTRVEVLLKKAPDRGRGGFRFFSKNSVDDNFSIDDGYISSRIVFNGLKDLIRVIAPVSDVSIISSEFENEENAVLAADWMSVAPFDLIQRGSYWDLEKESKRYKLEELLQNIEYNGKIYGRAAVAPSMVASRRLGALTSGGLRIRPLPHIVGVMAGEISTAARSAGSLAIPHEAISRWATYQAQLISKTDLASSRKAICAEIIAECGGNIGDLEMVRWQDRWMNRSELIIYLKDFEGDLYLHIGDVEYDEDEDDQVSKSDFDNYFEPSKDVIFISTLNVSFGEADGRFPYFSRKPRGSFLQKIFIDLLQEVWLQFECEYKDHVVGEVEGQDIYRDISVYSRAKS